MKSDEKTPGNPKLEMLPCCRQLVAILPTSAPQLLGTASEP